MRAYVFKLIFTLLLGLLSVVSFNYIIDPFNLYDSPKISGVNEVKQLVSRHLRLAKAIAVQQIKPQSIIIGSSTANTGMNPAHSGWQHLPVYNLSLTGANVYETYRYLQHAEAVAPIKTVVFVANFFMFNAYLANKDNFKESLLKVGPDGRPNADYSSVVVESLLSLDALRASIETIATQDKPKVLLANGQLEWGYRTRWVKQMQGYHNLFNHVEESFYKTYLPPPKHQYVFEDPDTQYTPFENFEKMVAFCRTHGIALFVIIPPTHMRLVETVKLMGLLPSYFTWKLVLANLVERGSVGSEHPAKLWDFSVLSPYNDEPLPPRGDMQGEVTWFWDGYHFKSQLGDMMLDRVFGVNSGKSPENFGVPLTLRNAPEQRQKLLEQLKRWEIRHPEALIELQSILIRAKQANGD